MTARDRRDNAPISSAELMAVVAITALSIGVVQALLGVASSETRPSSDTARLLILGAVPMANILAVGLLIRHRRRGRRAFRQGLDVFGAMALATYLVIASL